MTRARIVIVPTADDAADGAALHIAAALRAAVEARGVAHWATTGGSTAPAVYRHLGDPDHPAIPWDGVHVWWGDDRFVPRDHPLSNVKPFDDIVMDIGGTEEGAPLHRDHHSRPPVANLHPFPNAEAIGRGVGATWAAARVEAALDTAGLQRREGFPVLDLIVLGLGGDGHTLSVFPGSPAFDAESWTMAIPAPTHIEPYVERVTMVPGLVRVARDVLVVATGAGKAEVIASVLADGADERNLPARIADLDQATWLLDEDAAADLPQ